MGQLSGSLTRKRERELIQRQEGHQANSRRYPKRFSPFSDSVSDLQSSAKDVSEKVADMRENGNAYIKAWDEQIAAIKNEEIKKSSADRKVEVQKSFTEIKKSYAEAEMNFKPFMAGLKDIQAALGTDLTSGGVSAIKGVAAKTNKDGDALKTSLDKLAAKFQEMGVAMASSSAAPTGQPPQAK